MKLSYIEKHLSLIQYNLFIDKFIFNNFKIDCLSIIF